MFTKAKNLKLYKIKNPFLQELLWFHRIKPDQDRELLALEFLNVCASHAKEGNLFNKKLNKAIYNKEIQVRNILYNFPELQSIVFSSKEESKKWEEIESTLEKKLDFYKSVKILQKASLGIETSRRWTSKFLFPFSFETQFIDLNNSKLDIDRRFFSRGGEVLYMMLSRAKNIDTLKELMLEIFQKSTQNNRWNALLNAFRGNFKMAEPQTKLGFLSVESHKVFDNLVDDLITLFRSNISHNDYFNYLSSILSFYMVHFILTIAQERQKRCSLLKDGKEKVVYPIELLAPKSDHVRRSSRQIYKINEESPQYALKIVLDEYFSTLIDIKDKDEFLKRVDDELNYSSDKDKYSDKIELQETKKRVWSAVRIKVKRELQPIHRILLKGVGLASVKKTNSYRYLANDEWLKTLVLINVDKRMPFHEFVDNLYEKYGFIIGNRHSVLLLESYSENDFKKNENRLFERLRALGLLESKSDGYAYVLNKYGRK